MQAKGPPVESGGQDEVRPTRLADQALATASPGPGRLRPNSLGGPVVR
jgi:hypothetical protein